MRLFVSVLFLTFCLFACKSKDKRNNAMEANPDIIFFDYKVWAEEGSEEATIILQYKSGEDGQSLNTAESTVLFDGKRLKQDSLRFTGFYYEYILPLAELKRPHSIVFVDKDKKEHKEELSVEPFAFATELPEKLKKQPLSIRLNGLPQGSAILQLGIVDTSFASTDINEEVQVENGLLQIDSARLSKLTAGPVTLEIVREEQRPLKNPTRGGGQLLITYTLRRQLEFVE